jgi:hypothetical protein
MPMPDYDLSVARDFSRTPGSRYMSEGEHSGELFRREKLLPLVKRAMNEGVALKLDLDGTAGYGTSFLEEAFGGLVREDGIAAADLLTALKIKSEEEDYLTDDIVAYIKAANSSEEAR